MATMVGTTDFTDVLTELTELEYDAVEAYWVAVERLTDRENQRQLNVFWPIHRATSPCLGYIRSMGETPPDSGDFKQVLTKGKVYLGSIFGDRAILMVGRPTRMDTNTAYERALSRTDLPPPLRDMLEHNLADERRHRAWIETRVSDSDPHLVLDALIARTHSPTGRVPPAASLLSQRSCPPDPDASTSSGIVSSGAPPRVRRVRCYGARARYRCPRPKTRWGTG